MKLVFVVNPKASSMTPRGRILIQRALSAQHEVTAVETERRGQATRLARAAADDGADAVIALGGDGTQNEVANGLAGTNTALGCLPGGSTNVFARNIGMGNDPLKATTRLLDAMAANSRQRIGLGSADGRYFLFHVGVGFDAYVVGKVEEKAGVKRYAGHPFFVWSTLMAWAKFGQDRSSKFTVHFDDGGGGRASSVDGYLTICLNSNPYTYLGNRPFNIAPDLDLSNGLGVVTVKSLRFSSFGGLMASALISGRNIRRNPKADVRETVRSCRVEGKGKFPYQLDGEYLGDVEHLALEHHPAVLDVLMPAGQA